MKRFLFLLLCAYVTLFTNAQTPGWQWAQGGGGGGYPGSTVSNPGRDVINSTAFDSEGNLIVGGYCSWTPRFDTIQFPSVIGNTSWQGPTMYMAKYDPCGQVNWVTIAGGNGVDQLLELAVDKNDNIYTFNAMQNQGTPVKVNCPDYDTILPSNSNIYLSFSKWDKHGNLQYIRPYPTNNFDWNPVEGTGMKFLKNGTILTMVALFASSGTPNIQNIPVPNNSFNFVIFDTLGNVLKVKTIDTTYLQGSLISRFHVDEQENIYFSFVNSTVTQLNILGTPFTASAPYGSYLIKTDTSFQILDVATCDYCDPFYYLSYADGYLYAAGRNPIGASFDGDTNVTFNGRFTVYKIDLDLNRIWTSTADSQSLFPGSTNTWQMANRNHLYFALHHLGYTTWDSVTLFSPFPGSMTFLKLRTSDGVCELATTAGGNIHQSDEFTRVEIDPQGNPYFMGNYRQNLSVANDTIYANTGLTSPDFFILKWGLPCTDTLNSLNSPEAPDALIATAFSSTDVNIEWHNNATYRLGFKLFRSPNGTGNWQQIATTGPNTFSYNDGGLTPATTYWYKVLAYTTGGESAFSNIDSATTFGSVCSAAITRTNADSVYTFNANPTGFGNLSYQWSRNGLNFSTAATPSLTLSTPGTYSICVTVTDAANCTATDCDTVIITPFVCNASLAYTNADSVYSFVATGTGTAPFSYAWSNNGTAFSGGVNAQQILDNPGTYNICVTVTDANNCQSSDCEVITIAAPPVCSTNISSSFTDSTFSFSTTNTGASPFTYQWTANGNSLGSSATPNLGTALAGNYTICVTVTDAVNCTATDCETVTISSTTRFQSLSGNMLFPNPATTHVQILLTSPQPHTADIIFTDMQGRLAAKRTVNVQGGKWLYNFQIADWPSGIYQVSVQSPHLNWTSKMVKE